MEKTEKAYLQPHQRAIFSLFLHYFFYYYIHKVPFPTFFRTQTEKTFKKLGQFSKKLYLCTRIWEITHNGWRGSSAG